MLQPAAHGADEASPIVLTVNAGSSSVRLAAFEAGAGELRPCGTVRHETGPAQPVELLTAFVEQHLTERPQRVAHRVVHGGMLLTSARWLDTQVEAEIERLVPLAPLHNPAALAWVRACREVLGVNVPQLAVFDTAFYAQLPAVAATYAVPWQIAERHGLRRYGFHGLAHQALWSRWRELHPDLPEGGRLISFQLGAGCSVTANSRGRPRDTSMGFSPLEGLVMATRSGDIDPALVTYLQRAEGLSNVDIDRLLNERSGLLGVSGLSGDMRILLSGDDPRARLAVALYAYRARKYLGAYLAVLGGVDGIVFGGGVGEHAAAVRAAILEGMAWAGIRLDAAANAATLGREGRISEAGSAIEAWVIPVDEARVLAQEALVASAA
jgi:acetate kinase